MKKVRSFVLNVGLIFSSIVAFFLICEFILFRFFIPVTDMPENVFIDGLIRHMPGEQGETRRADGVPIPYAINAQGWNSGRESYQRDRRDGVERIAIIGDSYVEALAVPFDQSMAEKLEERLVAAGRNSEIFRFGISGAPLSQYLYMYEKEIVQYQPDTVIVLLVHNDFLESFLHKPGRYTSSFMKLVIENGSVIKETIPVSYEQSMASLLYKSAVFRYFHYQKKIGLGFFKRLIFGSRKKFQANIDVNKLENRWSDIEVTTRYLFKRFADIARDNGTDLLFVMDPHRQAIYDGIEATDAGGVAKLNRLARAIANTLGIPFLDLTAAFAADWQIHKRRFESPTDWHWNLRGHQLAAATITEFLTSSDRTSAGLPIVGSSN